MKIVVAFLILTAMLCINPQANAQCAQGPNATCVTSFTISPGAISGDSTETATGQVTAHLPPGVNQWEVSLSPGGLNFQGCAPPAVAFSYGCYVTGPAVTVYFFGINNQQTPIQGQMNASALYQNDQGITASVIINPIPPPSTPSQNPDGPCPSGNCGFGGKPINFTSGDTWISQQDYSIPGVGGGVALTRTWNSLWSLMQPPEQSGVFGDSWRSNFEERIQVLTGGVVKYWKGDGSKLFYLYDSLSGVYVLTAPLDDQTTISFNSSTALWTAVLKGGTQKIFNSAGYLTSIVDRNGNTIQIVIDAANQNRIASVTDAANRTLTFHYANGTFPRLCTSITDAVGTIAAYTYDASGRLTQALYPDSSQLNFQYNDPNSPTLISAVIDSQSRIIESHTYDSQRRGLTSQQANGVNNVTVALYGNGYTGIRDSRSNFSWVNYTTLAQREYLSSTTGYGCASCGFLSTKQQFISPQGYVIYSGDPFGLKPTQYSYDTQGNVLSVSRPYGDNYTFGIAGWNTWNYTYNAFGEVLIATDPLGHQTTNVYDTHGNLLTTTTPPPDGSTPASVTTFTYNTNGTLKTIKDPLNHITTLTYFPTGLINTIKDANNKTTTYAYDARGNRTSVIDPVNGSTKPTTFAYDSMNRLTSITYPAATTSVLFHYDYRGRRTTGLLVKPQNVFRTQAPGCASWNTFCGPRCAGHLRHRSR